ncbi:prephenate dehydrogenase dimerization domain-containing protein, partial [Silvibacterium sp.]|uniref:prephenate dehydrogenase dimerization domain-containing protein n=1 Tax=Silvibacterium sp. TaxID=1964179 RepID=UPI0039E71926
SAVSVKSQAALRKSAETQAMGLPSSALKQEWREWTARFGSRVLDLTPERHDEICAWVSHLPQYLATALSALLEDEFPSKEEIQAIGGRALREMTRLGSSPFSMWRDIAHTNTEAVAASILALEQRLQHLRENLKTPELREEFARANQFREGL